MGRERYQVNSTDPAGLSGAHTSSSVLLLPSTRQFFLDKQEEDDEQETDVDALGEPPSALPTVTANNTSSPAAVSIPITPSATATPAASPSPERDVSFPRYCYDFLTKPVSWYRTLRSWMTETPVTEKARRWRSWIMDGYYKGFMRGNVWFGLWLFLELFGDDILYRGLDGENVKTFHLLYLGLLIIIGGSMAFDLITTCFPQNSWLPKIDHNISALFLWLRQCLSLVEAALSVVLIAKYPAQDFNLANNYPWISGVSAVGIFAGTIITFFIGRGRWVNGFYSITKLQDLGNDLKICYEGAYHLWWMLFAKSLDPTIFSWSEDNPYQTQLEQLQQWFNRTPSVFAGTLQSQLNQLFNENNAEWLGFFRYVKKYYDQNKLATEKTLETLIYRLRYFPAVVTEGFLTKILADTQLDITSDNSRKILKILQDCILTSSKDSNQAGPQNTGNTANNTEEAHEEFFKRVFEALAEKQLTINHRDLMKLLGSILNHTNPDELSPAQVWLFLWASSLDDKILTVSESHSAKFGELQQWFREDENACLAILPEKLAELFQDDAEQKNEFLQMINREYEKNKAAVARKLRDVTQQLTSLPDNFDDDQLGNMFDNQQPAASTAMPVYSRDEKIIILQTLKQQACLSVNKFTHQDSGQPSSDNSDNVQQESTSDFLHRVQDLLSLRNIEISRLQLGQLVAQLSQEAASSIHSLTASDVTLDGRGADTTAKASTGSASLLAEARDAPVEMDVPTLDLMWEDEDASEDVNTSAASGRPEETVTTSTISVRPEVTANQLDYMALFCPEPVGTELYSPSLLTSTLHDGAHECSVNVAHKFLAMFPHLDFLKGVFRIAERNAPSSVWEKFIKSLPTLKSVSQLKWLAGPNESRYFIRFFKHVFGRNQFWEYIKTWREFGRRQMILLHLGQNIRWMLVLASDAAASGFALAATTLTSQLLGLLIGGIEHAENKNWLNKDYGVSERITYGMDFLSIYVNSVLASGLLDQIDHVVFKRMAFLRDEDAGPNDYSNPAWLVLLVLFLMAYYTKWLMNIISQTNKQMNTEISIAALMHYFNLSSHIDRTAKSHLRRHASKEGRDARQQTMERQNSKSSFERDESGEGTDDDASSVVAMREISGRRPSRTFSKRRLSQASRPSLGAAGSSSSTLFLRRDSRSSQMPMLQQTATSPTSAGPSLSATSAGPRVSSASNPASPTTAWPARSGSSSSTVSAAPSQQSGTSVSPSSTRPLLPDSPPRGGAAAANASGSGRTSSGAARVLSWLTDVGGSDDEGSGAEDDTANVKRLPSRASRTSEA